MVDPLARILQQSRHVDDVRLVLVPVPGARAGEGAAVGEVDGGEGFGLGGGVADEFVSGKRGELGWGVWFKRY